MTARFIACALIPLVTSFHVFADQDTNLYTVSTLSGSTFNNVTVRRADRDGVVFMTPKGVLKIAFTNLPPEWQQKYHYAQPTAAASPQRQEEMRLAAQSSPSIRLPPQATAESSMTKRDRAFYAQNVKGLYFLVNGKAVRHYGSVVQVIDAQRILFRFAGEEEPVAFSMDSTSNLYDGVSLDGPFLADRDGVFKYTSVGQVGKTVRAFRAEPLTLETFLEMRKSGVTFVYPPASIGTQPLPYPP